MALDSRIVRRPNGTYSFRAWVPADLRAVIPGGASGQKWIALGTSDPAEAKRRARLKSMEFDMTNSWAPSGARPRQDIRPRGLAALTPEPSTATEIAKRASLPGRARAMHATRALTHLEADAPAIRPGPSRAPRWRSAPASPASAGSEPDPGV